MFNKEINYTIAGAGIIAVASSVLNYIMSDDIISFGIFIFAGLGFIPLSFKSNPIETEKEKQMSSRIKNIAYFFMAISVLILLYWIIFGKLNFHL